MLIILRTIQTGICFVLFVLSSLYCMAQTLDSDNQHPFVSSSFSQTQTDMTEQKDKIDSFSQSVADFINDYSEKHHVDKSELNWLFDQIEPNMTVIKLVKPASKQKLKNWQAYRQKMVDPIRISAGLRFWNQYEKYLDMAQKQFGVPPHIIVGILGIESVYGNHTGHFQTIDVLTTLAFEYPDTTNQIARKAFFRKELENLLLLSRETGKNPMAFYGSYAGAIGYPQFMPSSIREYALDFDGDGKIDLENSAIDAIGSVANFLFQHGWNEKKPIVFPAQEMPNCSFNKALLDQGLEAKLTLEQLEKGCIIADESIPDSLLFGLVDLPNGLSTTEYWIGTSNFFVITHYNRSYFYAMSVILLGEEILQKKLSDNPMPHYLAKHD